MEVPAFGGLENPALGNEVIAVIIERSGGDTKFFGGDFTPRFRSEGMGGDELGNFGEIELWATTARSGDFVIGRHFPANDIFVLRPGNCLAVRVFLVGIRPRKAVTTFGGVEPEEAMLAGRAHGQDCPRPVGPFG